MTVSFRARTVILTAVSMTAFAANSVLARIALLGATVDAASFTTIRLASGAVTLALIMRVTAGDSPKTDGDAGIRGSWASALMLFLYAAPFSFAYVGLTTATGALILFGLVQVTMIAGALLLGERPTAAQWLGLSLAFVGLVYLMLPGIEAPPLSSALLMALAGFSWGLYSLSGRNAVDPLGETTGNFARSVLLVVGMTLVTLPGLHIEPAGVLLAVASGTLASGIGYVLWYAALRGLTATNAAVVQLSVPILAAAGGVAFLSEAITLRLALSALLILGGIAVAVLGRAPSHVEG
jgi:drug/metabolite transporter (DMT)-like permease